MHNIHVIFYRGLAYKDFHQRNQCDNWGRTLHSLQSFKQGVPTVAQPVLLL